LLSFFVSAKKHKKISRKVAKPLIIVADPLKKVLTIAAPYVLKSLKGMITFWALQTLLIFSQILI